MTGKTSTDDNLWVHRVARNHKMLVRRNGVHTNNMLGPPTNHPGKRLPDEMADRGLIVGKQVAVKHTRIVDRGLSKMLGNLQAFVVNRGKPVEMTRVRFDVKRWKTVGQELLGTVRFVPEKDLAPNLCRNSKLCEFWCRPRASGEYEASGRHLA